MAAFILDVAATSATRCTYPQRMARLSHWY